MPIKGGKEKVMRIIPVSTNHVWLELDNGLVLDVNDGTFPLSRIQRMKGNMDAGHLVIQPTGQVSHYVKISSVDGSENQIRIYMVNNK
jgi:hypothetical protein